MEGTYSMQLTKLESLYVSDALSMFTQGPSDALPDQGSPYPGLLLKVGSAVLETEQQEVSICFSLSELWVIREATKSSVVVGSERVGLNLLMKVYRGILALAADSDMQSVVSALGEVVDDEPGKNQYSAQLERIKDGESLEFGDKRDKEVESENIGSSKPGDPDEDRPGHDTATAA